MAGMLTDEEMAALAAARGSEFDRLYLENDSAPPGGIGYGGGSDQRGSGGSASL